MDAVNPVVVHCWEQDGVSYENGDNTYVAQVGTIRYRQKVTDDNNETPVVGEWSDPVVAEQNRLILLVLMQPCMVCGLRQTQLLDCGTSQSLSYGGHSQILFGLKHLHKYQLLLKHV